MLNIFSNHNGIKLKINYKNKTKKYSNMWRPNNILLNNELANSKIKEEIKRYLEANENTVTPKYIGHRQSSSKKEVHTTTGLPQEIKSQINNLKLLKELEKKEQPKEE